MTFSSNLSPFWNFLSPFDTGLIFLAAGFQSFLWDKLLSILLHEPRGRPDAIIVVRRQENVYLLELRLSSSMGSWKTFRLFMDIITRSNVRIILYALNRVDSNIVLIFPFVNLHLVSTQMVLLDFCSRLLFPELFWFYRIAHFGHIERIINIC